MIVNVDHWNNKAIKINYVCSRINEETANHIYARFDNFSNDLYEIWQDMIKNLAKTYENFDWKNKYHQLYLTFRQDSKFFVNFYVKFRQYISRLKYLKKSRDQLKMMNALLNKVFFRLRIVYNNLLKSSKILKKIKTYFTRVDNRYKVTRKIREKKRFKRLTKQFVFIRQNNSFHSFLDRFIRLSFSFLFIVSSTIVNKRMLTKTSVSIVMNKIMLQQIV